MVISTNHHKIQKSENPFEVVREHQRALNAVKLERVFAKPFVGALEGHRDGVSCVTRHPAKLNRFWSGAQDGELRQWDLTGRNLRIFKCFYIFVSLRAFTEH